jgi:hypothetical protein
MAAIQGGIMPDEKQSDSETQMKEKRAAAAAAAESESDSLRPTPGTAEGDRETIEQDIQDKLGNDKQ